MWVFPGRNPVKCKTERMYNKWDGVSREKYKTGKDGGNERIAGTQKRSMKVP